jgi:hypothetical protein
VVQHIDDLARREFNGHAIKLVAEYPGVSSQDAAFFFLLEFYGFHDGEENRKLKLRDWA